jgi:hypothetical protein
MPSVSLDGNTDGILFYLIRFAFLFRILATKVKKQTEYGFSIYASLDAISKKITINLYKSPISPFLHSFTLF